jgi:uncharacterized repeat protein (TIGR01451 family)
MSITNYRLNITTLFALLLLAGMSGNAAHAEDTIRLTSTAKQEVVETDAAGNRQVKRVAAKKVVPDDEVIYLIEFENTGAEAAGNIVIRNPVPGHTLYKAGSAAGSDTKISYSIDGGKQFDAPENLVITEADDTTRQATAADYTAIRWIYTKALQPGEKSSVEYRVVIK